MTSSTPVKGGLTLDQETEGPSQKKGSTADQIDASGSSVIRPGDRIFQILSVASSSLVTATIIAIAIFLLVRAVPSMSNNVANFLTYNQDWNLLDTSAMKFGIPNLFLSTVAVSLLALLLAMPVALGIAIFLTSYAPKKLVKPLSFLVDLLAAVPSIVYGIWGFMAVGPFLSDVYRFLGENLGFIFLFHHYANSPAYDTGRNLFTGGIVLAIMILPVIAATTREVFVQTPKGHIEAAQALGATRWEVTKMAVLPFGKSGYIAGSMLGLGRALGETMALYMVLAPTSLFRGSLLDGGTTFATAIANAAPEFNDNLKAGAYMSAGLVLFLLTFVVNSAARIVAGNKGK
ncbi:phosphate ABC transporter permease subunit PstC [Corynebacterium sp. TAE3-ERU12]|uniref:phosphate ABC transporter permease subunit PstC n=1 Tax=Corynebacterium sp. TAE3-ERU12 TaxID=2849491 RepID=UPI001C452BAA|nr:phosphate ABC transporter permease subunit PstC [Corynebacterium sp. TAE3-ERU12]MBV7295848.1 phosphate ABC transporter permease subunit PstC [Corynebacterium sp. TAE3-ERU12]